MANCGCSTRDCLKNSLTRPLERQSMVTHPEKGSIKLVLATLDVRSASL
jgi:hypothetical protein